jgi:hypothetical protein
MILTTKYTNYTKGKVKWLRFFQEDESDKVVELARMHPR